MTAFTFTMPAGIPGAVNRVGGGEGPVIEAVQQDPNNPLVNYGFAGVVDATSGCLRLPTAGDTAATLYGFLARPFPQQAVTAAGFSGQVTLGSGNTPPGAGKVVDVLRKGYMTVTLQAGGPVVKGGVVYVRLNGTGGGQGSVEGATGANLIATNWLFMGPADASGNVEIALV